VSCPCGGKGLIRVNYQDGTPFDLGVCTCPAGQWIRRRGPAGYALWAQTYGVTRDRVGPIEAFAEDGDLIALGLTSRVELEPFTQAGQVGKKAHL
jgi:hypothetical protein